MDVSLRCQKNSFTYIRLRGAYCVAASLALLGGIAIYVFFRDTNNLLVFRYFPQLLFLVEIRTIPVNTDTIWGYFFVFNLLHGLWCLSGLLVIRAIWLTNVKWWAIYGGTFITAASLLEFAQLNENIPGTFDVFDLTAYGVFALAESAIFNMSIRRRFL